MGVNVIFNDFNYEVLPKQKETWDRYVKLIQWGRQNPTRFCEDIIGLQLTDYQKYIFLSTWNTINSVILASRSSGKATSLDTKVWTKSCQHGLIDHWKTVGDLKVGDKIYDSKGQLSEIIHLNPIIFDNYYEVEFEDGEVIKCNGEHLWLVHDRNFHKTGQDLNDFRLLNTDYIYHHINRASNNNLDNNKIDDYVFHVPINKPIKYAKYSKLPIDPYVLGYYLGGGCTTSGVITCSIDDIEDAVDNLKKVSSTCRWKIDKHKENCGLICVDFEQDLKKIGIKCANQKSLKNKLTNLENLLYDKHIPDRYLYSSISDRLSLLQGLMDTDGSIDYNGKCEFTQSNQKNAEDVCQLIRSLGMKCTLTHKIHTGYIKKDGSEADTWRIYFSASKEMPVFRLQRKYNRLPDHPCRAADRKAIVDIRKVEEKIPMRCITMRNDDGTFLCGNNFTVTHNSFFSAPYIMCRSLLFPNHKTYIMSNTGGQSAETMKKLEDLATGNIASVIGVSSVFIENAIAANSKVSAFTHGKDGSHVALFNGSEVTSLTSVPDNLRGIRSSLNVYDRI